MASAQSIILQKPSFQWKNHSHHSPQLLPQNYFSRVDIEIRKSSVKKLSVNCLFTTNNNSAVNQRVSKISLGELETKQNPVEMVAETVMNMLGALRKPAVAALVLGLLLMCRQNSALAASGGRMGGSSFSSRSSSGRSSSSRSSSGSGSSFSSSSSSGSRSSSSGSGSGSYKKSSSWSGSGSYSTSRPQSYNKSRTDDDDYSTSRPQSYSKSRTDDDDYSTSRPRSYSKSRTDDDDYSTSRSQDYARPPLSVEDIAGLVIVTIIFALCLYALVEAGTVKTSVLKLQVGLLGSAKSLQKDLNRIAETADTSASKGLHYVMTETVVSLLRHPDYCISGYSSVHVKRGMEAGEQKFNQLSVEERGKFDEETLVNVNNIKKKSSTILKADGFCNEYIVVTILVAAEGKHKLPSINSSKDLKEALQKLASITSSETLAVEVLWTPQKEDDTLSELELREDYPLLRPLQ